MIEVLLLCHVALMMLLVTVLAIIADKLSK